MQKIDPLAVWGFFFRSLPRYIILIVFISIWGAAFLSSTNSIYINSLNPLLHLPLIITVIIIFLIFLYIWAKLTYHYYGYQLSDIGFKKESGVITKKYVTIPYDRIQNVDINRGLISRILGLSDLLIQTAGSSAVMGRYGALGVGAEGELFGLNKEVAEKLRDELILRAHNSKNNQGL